MKGKISRRRLWIMAVHVSVAAFSFGKESCNIFDSSTPESLQILLIPNNVIEIEVGTNVFSSLYINDMLALECSNVVVDNYFGYPISDCGGSTDMETIEIKDLNHNARVPIVRIN